MRRPLRPRGGRAGFTLVELLVATALTILVMTILAAAFQTGLAMMSDVKSVADLANQLDKAKAAILQDLGGVHLEDEWGKPVQVSSPAVQAAAWASTNNKRGFFKVRQVSPPHQNFNTPPSYPYDTNPNYPFLFEGTDQDQVPSFRAVDQVLHLSVKLSGVNIDQVFVASAPDKNPPAGPGDLVNSTMNRQDLRVGNQFVSDWAEVAYFLQPSPVQTAPDDEGNVQPLNLYTLYRRQRVLTPGPFSFSPALDQNQYPGLSVPPISGSPSNDPLAITDPTKRLTVDAPAGSFASASIPSTSPEYGSDVLLTNVVSFQIRLQFADVPGFQDVWTSITPDGAGARVYDTASAGGATKPRITAIQIKVRMYDTRNKMTRQVTITTDL